MNTKKIITGCSEFEKKAMKKSELIEKQLNGTLGDGVNLERYAPAIYTVLANNMKQYYEKVQMIRVRLYRNVLKPFALDADERVATPEIEASILTKVIPFYQGSFTIDQSREISFLPPRLRLKVYATMHKNEHKVHTRMHLKDRLAITLLKMGEDRAAEQMYFLKWFDLLEISNELKEEGGVGQVKFNSILSDVLTMEDMKKGRSEILRKRGFKGDSNLDEMKQGLGGFTDLRHVMNRQAAQIMFELFSYYYPVIHKSLALKDAVNHYLNTADRSKLDQLNIERIIYIESTSVNVEIGTDKKIGVSGNIPQAKIHAIEQFKQTIKTMYEENPNGAYSLGQTAEQNRNYKKAIQIFEQLVDLGDANAYAYLGSIYLNASGKYRDTKKAIQYLEQAVEQNSDLGYTYLGGCYMRGNGMNKDLSKALELFKKGAKLGNAVAQVRMAAFYHEGWGTEKEYEKAIYWAEKSADQQNMEGIVYYGFLLMSGRGTTVNTKKAASLFELAYEQDSRTEATFYLGQIYFEALGEVEQDLEMAIKWFTIAANAGDADARKRLSFIKHNLLR